MFVFAPPGWLTRWQVVNERVETFEDCEFRLRGEMAATNGTDEKLNNCPVEDAADESRPR